MIVAYLNLVNVADVRQRLTSLGKVLGPACDLRNGSNYEALLIPTSSDTKSSRVLEPNQRSRNGDACMICARRHLGGLGGLRILVRWSAALSPTLLRHEPGSGACNRMYAT